MTCKRKHRRPNGIEFDLTPKWWDNRFTIPGRVAHAVEVLCAIEDVFEVRADPDGLMAVVRWWMAPLPGHDPGDRRNELLALMDAIELPARSQCIEELLSCVKVLEAIEKTQGKQPAITTAIDNARAALRRFHGGVLPR